MHLQARIFARHFCMCMHTHTSRRKEVKVPNTITNPVQSEKRQWQVTKKLKANAASEEEAHNQNVKLDLTLTS